MKDPQIVAACDFAGLFGCEAAAQHRLTSCTHCAQSCRRLPGATCWSVPMLTIDADDIDNLFQPFDILIQVGEEVPDADRTAGFCNRRCVVSADPEPVAGR